MTTPRRISTPRTRQNLEFAFRALDADESGRLQVDEVKALVSSLGAHGAALGREQIEGMMRHAAIIQAGRAGDEADADKLAEDAVARGMDFETFYVFAEICLGSDPAEQLPDENRCDRLFRVLGRGRASIRPEDVAGALSDVGVFASLEETKGMVDAHAEGGEVKRADFQRIFDGVFAKMRASEVRQVAVDVQE